MVHKHEHHDHGHLHQTHPQIIKRLKRVSGHLAKVISMIEEQRPCLDLAQQLHAVEKAVSSAKATLIHDHIDHCLDETMRRPGPGSRRAMDEFKQITKYL
ncbi:MAG: metal-sensing transcriptional repressor [Planctomycetes bacterium]|nr:metal-sensing transcriptional repressor [Planctomycetota bacterium]